MRFLEATLLSLRVIKYCALSGNLAYLSMLGRPRKALSYLSTNFFYYQLASGRGLPQKSIYEAFGRDHTSVWDITLAGHNWLDHWQSFVGVDLVNLCLITRIVSPQCIFEIGTFDGTSALHFALNSPSACRVFTLDLPETEDTLAPTLSTTCSDREIIAQNRGKKTLFEDTLICRKITRLYGDSARFDFTPYCGKVDIFFVDGAHSYEYVRSDTRNALKCCRKGGIILWHDYRPGTYGVQPYLERLAREMPIYRLPGSSLAVHIVQ